MRLASIGIRTLCVCECNKLLVLPPETNCRAVQGKAVFVAVLWMVRRLVFKGIYVSNLCVRTWPPVEPSSTEKHPFALCGLVSWLGVKQEMCFVGLFGQT